MVRLLAALFSIAAFLVVAVAAGAWWAWTEVNAPGPSEAATLIRVERGAGLAGVSDALEREGVIRDARLFRGLAVVREQHRRLRFGEYQIPAGASTAEVLAVLVEGRPYTRRLTIPEGLTSAQVQARLAEAPALEGEAPEFAEGSVLPETYSYTWGDTREQLAARMRRAMEIAVEEAWQARREDLPLSSPNELVVLASIVERETGVADERPRVAAVFVNRLRRGMRLQSDPTVAYGVGDPTKTLTRADLESDTPYNTYRIDRLPPGPIANPGRAALMAAANPPDTDEYYFVADGTGGHAFGRTLQEHNSNVARWRRIQRERGLR